MGSSRSRNTNLGSGASAPTPLARAERRQVLLDVAALMVAAGEIEQVSMESVADRAGVSRALVYKHFANRGEMLSALYERESAHLHAAMAAKVEQARTLEDMLRALVEGALEAQASRGATFAALAARGSRPPQQRSIQRRRDARTLRFFTRRAVAELDLDESVARTAVDLALSSIPLVLSQWRRRATAAHAADLADIYVSMTMAGLKSLARPRVTKLT